VRLIPLLGLALAAGLAAGGAALSAAAPPAVKLPAAFTFPKADTSPGSVTFSHATHFTKVGKCTRCHYKIFKMKQGQSGPITLEAKTQGKYCGACHDGKTTMAGAVVFPIDECDKCHAS
jgi:c(7)-type cytochrome triheme protein